MALGDLNDRQAVLDAISEFDRIGRGAFLTRYGFGKATAYFVQHEGSYYDSKAIVGAAHGYQHGTPLTASEFSGGEATVVASLGALGFHVLRPDSWEFAPGDVTTRSRVKELYGGSMRGGIEPSSTSPNLMIYSDPTAAANYGYDYDGWDEDHPDVYYYTGDGRVGDQQITSRGNKAILEHADRGRMIRLFEAVDGRKRPGGKLQRYVGAFRVDPTAPYRFELAPDQNGAPRQVVVFRLLRDDAPPVAVAHTASSATPSTVPSGRVKVEFVDSENNKVREYETAPRTGAVARREEAALVDRFEADRGAMGHEVGRFRITVPGENQQLVTDTFDKTNNTLYEAKSSVNRPTVRLAVGQILDYKRFMEHDVKLALLLPTRPSEDVTAFIRACGIGVVHADGTKWTEV